MQTLPMTIGRHYKTRRSVVQPARLVVPPSGY